MSFLLKDLRVAGTPVITNIPGNKKEKGGKKKRKKRPSFQLSQLLLNTPFVLLLLTARKFDSLSAWPIITNYRLGVLNNRNSYPVVLEAGKIRVLTRWVSFGGFFSWLVGAAILVGAHVTFV